MKQRGVLGLLALAALAVVVLAVLYWLRQPRTAPDRTEPPSEPPVQSPESLRELKGELERLRRGGKTLVRWRAAAPAELVDYRSWVDGGLSGALGGAAPRRPAPAGFQALPLSGVGELLVERQDRRRGAGALVLRGGEARPWIIEVPHSFFDEGTLDIGLAAFDGGNARALLVNTVHRRRALTQAAQDAAKAREDAENEDDGSGEEDEPAPSSSGSDVAHAEGTFYLAAHRACVDALGAAWVLQLHGFSDRSAPFDAVVSAARTVANPIPLARALEQTLGIEAAAYPTDVQRLGGTQNQQARYSASQGKRFIHLELSRSLRRRLHGDPELLRRFVAVLVETPP